ncbi:hypothetical protein LSAT2_024218 [Lamellibrachia satsuma]|nr:hypothetical protein LSAT2_024218 [Lamellibrachia satsuma]
MFANRRIFFILAISGWAGTNADPSVSAMLETPINTVVPRGGQLRAYCMSSNPRDKIIFRHYRKSTTVTIIDDGTVSVVGPVSGQSDYASRSNVMFEPVATTPSLRRVVFEIAFADFDDAGTYSCQSERNHTIYYFEVIVLGGRLKCQNNLTNNAVREGDLFEFGCTVEHSGVWCPHLQWSDTDKNLTSRRLVQRPSRLTTAIQGWLPGDTFAAIQTRASRSMHGYVYRCVAVFAFKREPMSNEWASLRTGVHATNAPSYQTTYSSRPLIVYYPPVVSNRPQHRFYGVGQTLSITASSRPAAHRYAWLDEVVGTRYNGSEIVTSADMVHVNNFTCVAFNRIFGVEFNGTIKINFEVVKQKKKTGDGNIQSMLSAQNKTGSRAVGLFVKAMVLSGLMTMCVLCTVVTKVTTRKKKKIVIGAGSEKTFTRKKTKKNSAKNNAGTKTEQPSAAGAGPEETTVVSIEPEETPVVGIEPEETPVVRIEPEHTSDETGRFQSP